jgi:spore maturation protein CgeB
VGLDLFGFGFDTVRYWELPALGCLLLAERRPIELPFDFVDGRHALLFEDLAELEDRLAWCGAHADAVTELARAGYAHFHRHHTESARARQFVAMAEAALASREQG